MLSFSETHAHQAGRRAAVEAICREADRLARYDLATAIRESSVNAGAIAAIARGKAGH